jgi:hypothetical protein
MTTGRTLTRDGTITHTRWRRALNWPRHCCRASSSSIVHQRWNSRRLSVRLGTFALHERPHLGEHDLLLFVGQLAKEEVSLAA